VDRKPHEPIARVLRETKRLGIEIRAVPPAHRLPSRPERTHQYYASHGANKAKLHGKMAELRADAGVIPVRHVEPRRGHDCVSMQRRGAIPSPLGNAACVTRCAMREDLGVAGSDTTRLATPGTRAVTARDTRYPIPRGSRYPIPRGRMISHTLGRRISDTRPSDARDTRYPLRGGSRYPIPAPRGLAISDTRSARARDIRYPIPRRFAISDIT
jgi:hypothetical protein